MVTNISIFSPILLSFFSLKNSKPPNYNYYYQSKISDLTSSSMLFIFIYIYIAVSTYIIYNKYINISDFEEEEDEMQKPNSSIASGIGVGHVISLSFCTSYNYRGHAMATKSMLEAAFPGIKVILSNHPAPFMKRLMGKLIPIFQVGVIGIIMGGEQIFQKFGYKTPPPWFYTLKANRYGTVISTWLFGNYLQSQLKNSGAFEVSCNCELIFSKLMEQRFPGEFELREIVSRKIYNVEGFEDPVGSLS